ncbi:MAG: ribonuclease H-like domain-containing protein [Syntrophales bacterium]
MSSSGPAPGESVADMNVIKRLQRLTGEEKSPPVESVRSAEISDLRKRIDAVLFRRPASRIEMSPPSFRGPSLPLEECVPGGEITTAGGRFFCVESGWGVSHHHGCRCIGDLSPLDMTVVSKLANDSALAGLDYTRGVFLDTETTGLAGGTGTVAFLVGLGWFEGSRFVMKQLFLRDYSEERAALVFLRELVQDRQFLVTFNGKAFDVNLLTARFILNRLADPLASMPHLDLLHPSRRLLRHRLDNVRLGTIEGAVLALEREGDVPGYEIPQRYFDWLKRRDGRLMADVFLHNRLDVLSMAALTAHLTEMIAAESTGPAPRPPQDLLAAARLLMHRGDTAGARRMLTELRSASCPATVLQACRLLSLIHKRAGEWTQAVEIWEEMISRVPDDGFTLVELAKWHEHRSRDYATALDLARRALYVLPLPGHERERESLSRRIARLERRQDRGG